MIQREWYLKELISYKDKQLIKILTGIRRCGKSTLLEIYEAYLLEHGVEDNQIITINFEDMDFADLTDAKALYAYIKERMDNKRRYYIFLDEVQHVKGFQKVVDSLFIKKNTDVYITGSNAYMLSGEMATLLSGRYVEIKVMPLSFKEYIGYCGDRIELNKKYADYLQFSSFPYTTELAGNLKQINDYLGGIYNTVVLKDVVARKNVSDVMMLESFISFMFDNIGNSFSTKKISDTMTSEGRKISTHTVESYLSALIDSYIIYRAKRYDVKGKQYLKTMEKYYVIDIALRHFLIGNKGTDRGHILENVIYLELLRRGYEVYIGKVDSGEVDFIAKKSDITVYYQVALTVREEKTLERELLPLNKIADHYPKYILTLDEDVPANYNGIRIRNALEFLLEDDRSYFCEI